MIALQEVKCYNVHISKEYTDWKINEHEDFKNK